MKTTEDTLRRPPAARMLGALALGLLVAAIAPDGTVDAQEGNGDEAATGQLEREEPLARVGMTEDFTAALDSAPETAGWQLFRESVGVRYEPGRSEDLEPGERKRLVVHAAIMEEGEISEHHTSDAVEVLPGGTRISPNGDYLPEGSMIPDGLRISDLMALGEIEVEPGEIMSELVRDIIADMTTEVPALYLAATPAEDEVEGPHKIHPVLVQFAPAGG